MLSLLNNENIRVIPLYGDEFYTIGYIISEDRKISPLALRFT